MAVLATNLEGKIWGKFKIPANVPAGAKLVSFTDKGGARISAIYRPGQFDCNYLAQCDNQYNDLLI